MDQHHLFADVCRICQSSRDFRVNQAPKLQQEGSAILRVIAAFSLEIIAGVLSYLLAVRATD